VSARETGWDIRQMSRELLVVFGVLLALNGAFYVFFLRPRLAEYHTLSEENKEGVDALDRREALVREREEYVQGLEQAKADLERLRSEVLSTRDQRMIEVQQELADLAEQFNIDMEEVTYANEILEDEGIERFAMTVPLEGGYANLRKFLHAVENSEEFLVIERVALREGEEGGVVLSLQITLATYFDLPKRAVAPGEAGKA
jgi:Tfp pilus assembly protein PilO